MKNLTRSSLIAQSQTELNELVNPLSLRSARFLEKRGLLERDAENTGLNLEEEEGDALTQRRGASVPCRIATGPEQGRKVFTLPTLPNPEGEDKSYGQVAKVAGFSLHAGVMAETHQRDGVFDGVPHHPNSKHRALVTPAKRGKKAKKSSSSSDTQWIDKTAEERHRAMDGFCSCKTGIHTLHGNISHRHYGQGGIPFVGQQPMLCCSSQSG